MDTSNIPKAFWYSLSLCMVIATLGLLYIAYQSSSVSIEIANAKIELSSALSTTKEIKSELERENERLKQANQLLQARFTEWATKGKQTADANGGGESTKAPQAKPLEIEKPIVRSSIIKPETFEKLDRKIEQAQQGIMKK